MQYNNFLPINVNHLASVSTSIPLAGSVTVGGRVFKFSTTMRAQQRRFLDSQKHKHTISSQSRTIRKLVSVVEKLKGSNRTVKQKLARHDVVLDKIRRQLTASKISLEELVRKFEQHKRDYKL